MTIARNHINRSHSVFMALAALAMCVRALVPAGWMIAPDADTGQPRIQVCSGHWVNWNPETGETTDIDQSDDAQDTQQPETGPQCPYALTAQALASLNIVFLAEDDVWTRTSVPRPSTGPPASRINQTQLPARGPPHSA